MGTHRCIQGREKKYIPVSKYSKYPANSQDDRN